MEEDADDNEAIAELHKATLCMYQLLDNSDDRQQGAVRPGPLKQKALNERSYAGCSRFAFLHWYVHGQEVDI